MKYKKVILLILCTLTLVGCSNAKDNKNKEETKKKVEVAKKDNAEKNIINNKKEDKQKKDETVKTPPINEVSSNEFKNNADENVSIQEVENNKNSNEEAVVNESIQQANEKNEEEIIKEPEKEISIGEEEAKTAIKNNAEKSIQDKLEKGAVLEKIEDHFKSNWNNISKNWGIPEDKFLMFGVSEQNSEYYSGTYAVAINSGNVYLIPTQGYVPAYHMQNGERVKIYNWVE